MAEYVNKDSTQESCTTTRIHGQHGAVKQFWWVGDGGVSAGRDRTGESQASPARHDRSAGAEECFAKVKRGRRAGIAR